MNLLVTGATGFIGKNLIAHLKQYHQVHILLRPQSLQKERDVSGVFVFDDNFNDLVFYINTHKIQGVIHLASLYIVSHEPEQIHDLVYSNIYLGTIVLEASVKASVKWFLNTGTIWQNYIYDSETYCPVNLYAASKQAFIDMAQYYAEVYKIRFCTLKLCDTYGIRDTRKKIFSLLKQISESKESLDMSPGEQLLDILHIDDVVLGFEQLIQLLDSDSSVEKEYKLSSMHLMTLRELAKEFECVGGLPLNINWGGRSYRDREVMIPWFKGTLLPLWYPKVNIKEGIQQLLKNGNTQI